MPHRMVFSMDKNRGTLFVVPLIRMKSQSILQHPPFFSLENSEKKKRKPHRSKSKFYLVPYKCNVNSMTVH